MEIFKGAEKVVVNACDYHPAAFWHFNHNKRGERYSAIYLHLILADEIR